MEDPFADIGFSALEVIGEAQNSIPGGGGGVGEAGRYQVPSARHTVAFGKTVLPANTAPFFANGTSSVVPGSAKPWNKKNGGGKKGYFLSAPVTPSSKGGKWTQKKGQKKGGFPFGKDNSTKGKGGVLDLVPPQPGSSLAEGDTVTSTSKSSGGKPGKSGVVPNAKGGKNDYFKGNKKGQPVPSTSSDVSSSENKSNYKGGTKKGFVAKGGSTTAKSGGFKKGVADGKGNASPSGSPVAGAIGDKNASPGGASAETNPDEAKGKGFAGSTDILDAAPPRDSVVERIVTAFEERSKQELDHEGAMNRIHDLLDDVQGLKARKKAHEESLEATRLHLLQQNLELAAKDEADEAEAQRALEDIRAQTLDLLKSVEEKAGVAPSAAKDTQERKEGSSTADAPPDAPPDKSPTKTSLSALLALSKFKNKKQNKSSALSLLASAGGGAATGAATAATTSAGVPATGQSGQTPGPTLLTSSNDQVDANKTGATTTATDGSKMVDQLKNEFASIKKQSKERQSLGELVNMKDNIADLDKRLANMARTLQKTR
ncbi:unnamed protein product [Amoebophrya sp. A25]|nr:unnamed protein product [Amoebophrya sp. A25]|eukprot:GSA25T00018213001.1